MFGRRLLVAGLLVAFVGCASGRAELPRVAVSTAGGPTPALTPSPDPVPSAAAVEAAAAPVRAAAAAPSRPRLLPGEDLSPPRATVQRRSSPARGPSGVTRIGRIIIPAIGLDVAIYEGTSMKVLAHGPGHWHGKAMPGEQGNSLFSGHRTTYTRPFHNIDKLRKGDKISYETKDGVFTYIVYDHFVIYPDEWWVADDGDGWITTIMACHPKGSARQRYVVRGRLVNAPTPRPTPEPEPEPTPKQAGGIIRF